MGLPAEKLDTLGDTKLPLGIADADSARQEAATPPSPSAGPVRRLKNIVRDAIAHTVAKVVPTGVLADNRYFDLFERKGLHITPVHFYSPTPDTRDVKSSHFDQHTALPGINMRDADQLQLLQQLAAYTTPDARRTPELDSLFNDPDYQPENFTGYDLEMLFGMVRHAKPQRVIEVGAGVSSYCIGQALAQNHLDDPDYHCDYLSIDPYPHPILEHGVPHQRGILENKVQDIPFSEFERLQDGDILFIDSTHVSKIGSDVNYLFLEVLPRLNDGVIIHVHDIYLPNEYHQRWVMKQHIFWNEQYLLQAFLAFNSSFQVMLAGNYLHTHYTGELSQALVHAPISHEPGSFWMRKQPAADSITRLSA
jgi:hypothetical protein